MHLVAYTTARKLHGHLHGFLSSLIHLPKGVQVCRCGEVTIKLDLSDKQHLGILQAGKFESELTSTLEKIIFPGDIFVDIGAHIGWHTISLLAKCANIRYAYAFEPSQKSFYLLKENISLNKFQLRCEIQQVAVGNHEGKMILKHFSELGSMHSSLYPLADWEYSEEQIDIVTLDSLSKHFVGAPSVIKCDVEGSERDVLVGAKDIMSGNLGTPPIWFLEANYETAGMAGFFPWQLIETASQYAPYQGFYIRNQLIMPLPQHSSLRHGDTLILAIPDLHKDRLNKVNSV